MQRRREHQRHLHALQTVGLRLGCKPEPFEIASEFDSGQMSRALLTRQLLLPGRVTTPVSTAAGTHLLRVRDLTIDAMLLNAAAAVGTQRTASP